MNFFAIYQPLAIHPLHFTLKKCITHDLAIGVERGWRRGVVKPRKFKNGEGGKGSERRKRCKEGGRGFKEGGGVKIESFDNEICLYREMR